MTTSSTTRGAGRGGGGRDKGYERLEAELGKGRQAHVVYPLIEERVASARSGPSLSGTVLRPPQGRGLAPAPAPPGSRATPAG